MSWPTNAGSFFANGDHIILKHVWADRVCASLPVTVIHDSADSTALYMAPGTIFMRPDCTREEYLRVLARGSWNLVADQWYPQHHVWLSTTGESCSIWTMWTDPGWELLGWKVNPETPWQRTEIGFDTTDHVLDAVINCQLNSWAWKDENEFAQATELGLFSVSESKQIRQETLRLANEALTTRYNLLKQWARWRPPAGWEIPKLDPQSY